MGFFKKQRGPFFGFKTPDVNDHDNPSAAIGKFKELSDVPSSYVGQSIKGLRVKASEDGIEFYTLPTPSSIFIGLTDVPNTYTGSALKGVRVNSGATGLEFYTITNPSTPNLSSVLAVSNSTGSNHVIWNSQYDAKFENGIGDFTTTLSNNQVTAANRTVLLPKFSGSLCYQATGSTLGTNYILKGTTNGEVISSSLIYDNGTNVGIGTVSPIFKLDVVKNSNSFNQTIFATNSNGGNVSAVSIGAYNGSNQAELGILGTGNTANTGYGAAGNGFLYLANASRFNFVAADGIDWNFYFGQANTTPILKMSFGIGVGFNTNTVSAIAHIKGSTSDSSAYAMKVDNSASSPLLYVRNDGASAINSSSLVPTAALKIKGRLIVSSQEVIANDNYITMLEVGVGNGVLFSNGTNGTIANNQLGYILGDGGLQLIGRNVSNATKFQFSGKAAENRMRLFSDDSNDTLSYSNIGVLTQMQLFANDGFNIIKDNTGTTTNATYSAMSVINSNATVNRLSIIGFTAVENTARHAFIGARFIDGSNGQLILGTKSSGVEAVHFTIKQSGVFNTTRPLGNGGLVAGDEYVDTAANILLNGDLIVGRKV